MNILLPLANPAFQIQSAFQIQGSDFSNKQQEMILGQGQKLNASVTWQCSEITKAILLTFLILKKGLKELFSLYFWTVKLLFRTLLPQQCHSQPHFLLWTQNCANNLSFFSGCLCLPTLQSGCTMTKES